MRFITLYDTGAVHVSWFTPAGSAYGHWYNPGTEPAEYYRTHYVFIANRRRDKIDRVL